MELTVDAVCTADQQYNNVNNFSHGRISEIVLQDIFDEDLDYKEVVSIIFLMTDTCTDFSATVNALKVDYKSRFFEIPKERNWKEKFLEALITIQNENVLIRLGFKQAERDAMKSRYSYDIHNVTPNLNRIVKSLYFLCEELTCPQFKKLVEEVYKDLNAPVLDSYSSEMLLEIYMLDWMQRKYISIDTENINLDRFINVLKRNTLLPSSLNFESWKSSNSNRENQQDSSGQFFLLQNATNIININNKVPWHDKEHKRLCIIVNQIEFNNQLLYETRAGSNTDKEALVATFKGMNFEIIEKKNLTSPGMIELLNSLNGNGFEKYAAIFLCILSHGKEGEIIFSDGKCVTVKKIKQKVCCNNLKNVFKFIILQSCQGKKIGLLNSNYATDSPLYLENNRPLLQPDLQCLYQKHFGLYQATVDEYVSIRHVTEGSWFIQAACDELQKTSPINLTEWVKNVNKRVSRLTVETTIQGNYFVQVPDFKYNTISEDYEFPKYNS